MAENKALNEEAFVEMAHTMGFDLAHACAAAADAFARGVADGFAAYAQELAAENGGVELVHDEEDEEPEKLEDISREGFGGVLCIETGGPTPGLGCAGRGIIATFQLLEDLRLFETYQPDVVLYDVLGDVVCGGFAAPIREGYAEKVLIVTSGEKMALYAANNISSAVRNFEDRSYARVFGIVLNHRNVENETEKVQAFADKSGIPIVGEIPRSDEIIRWEDQGKTVIEGDAKSSISRRFFDLAEMLLKAEEEE